MPREFYHKLLDIITNFADKCHHGKEEIVLFPLVKAKDANQSERIACLLEEHEEGRGFVAALRQAIDRDDELGKKRNADSYSKLLTGHIQKENNLFVSWFRLLSADDKELLFDKFEEIEQKVIGIGKHTEYSALVDEFSLKVDSSYAS